MSFFLFSKTVANGGVLSLSGKSGSYLWKKIHQPNLNLGKEWSKKKEKMSPSFVQTVQMRNSFCV